VNNIKTYTDSLNEAESQEDLNRELLDAAREGKTSTVKDLLDRGAQVDARDKYGSTPLHRAAIHDHTDIARLLLDRGAEVDARDRDGQTPLHWAARNDHTDIARLLLDRGAEVDARDRDGQTPLHWAAFYGRKDTARLLLDRGAEVDARNKYGHTPLYNAAFMGFSSTDTARFLIQSGADPFKAFKGTEEVLEFFRGDVDWMPEDIKAKLKRMQRGKQAFGM
jgi:ankyrin repeat protein